jgi:hypothetical protein
MVTRIERLFLVLIIFLGLFVVQSSRTYAGSHVISTPKGQEAVWSFYKSMRDIQAIQKKAPQSLKHIYDPMINMPKTEIKKICKNSRYLYTGKMSAFCDILRAGFVCREVAGKDFCKEGKLEKCSPRGTFSYCWPPKYR